jgi:hypothetical protein
MTHPADTAFADQLQAAEDHLASILARTAPRLGLTEETSPSPWLSDRIEQFAEDILSGDVHVCDHLAQPASPQPAFGIFGNSPGRLACLQCVRILLPADLSTPIHCDHCGCPIDDAGPVLVEVGPVALLVLLCNPCAELEDNPLTSQN